MSTRKRRPKLSYGGQKLADAFVDRALEPGHRSYSTSRSIDVSATPDRMVLGDSMDSPLHVAEWRGDALLLWSECLELEKLYNEPVRNKVSSNVIYAAKFAESGSRHHWNVPLPDYVYEVPLFRFDMSAEDIRSALFKAAHAKAERVTKTAHRRSCPWSTRWEFNSVTKILNTAYFWSSHSGLPIPSAADLPPDYAGHMAATAFRFKVADRPKHLDLESLAPCYNEPNPNPIAA